MTVRDGRQAALARDNCVPAFAQHGVRELGAWRMPSTRRMALVPAVIWRMPSSTKRAHEEHGRGAAVADALLQLPHHAAHEHGADVQGPGPG